MIKPKVALVKDGFLPAGSENKRGRLSAAAIERCKELAAAGMQIEGYSLKDSKVKDSAGKPEKTVVKEKVTNPASTVQEPFYRYGEDGVNTHEAVTVDGRVYDLRQACHCGYSLSGHVCDNPAILTENIKAGHERVTVRLKKKIA